MATFPKPVIKRLAGIMAESNDIRRPSGVVQRLEKVADPILEVKEP